jgi:heptosyltransferase-2/heptosyltransferase-3
MPLTHAVRDALLPLGARLTRRAHGVDDTLLIVQPDHLGDILLAQPAVRRLRAAFPERRLIAVVGPWSQRIVELAWPVDEVRTVAFPGFTREAPGGALDPYRQLFAEARGLAPLAARDAVVLRPDAWWAAWLARGAVSGVGAGGDDARARRFLTRAARLADTTHATQRACAIVAELTGASAPPTPRSDPLELPVQDAAADVARVLLQAAGVRDDYVVVHPGAGAAVKLWPPQRWRSVIDWFQHEGLRVVVTGGDGERALVEDTVDGAPGAVSLAGQTPLDVLIETLRGATLVLGPDCGPLHLAVATGTPTVHVFGPSDPARYGPWGPAYNHRVVTANWSCPRCGDLSAARPSGCGCMLAVDVEEVLDAARRLLHGHASAR